MVLVNATMPTWSLIVPLQSDVWTTINILGSVYANERLCIVKVAVVAAAVAAAVAGAGAGAVAVVVVVVVVAAATTTVGSTKYYA